MTTSLVGGHNLGLLDSSATLLNRNERISNGSLGQGEQPYANVANGNLIIQQRDVLLPSRGADFELVRTYNSRGYLNGPAKNWTLSTAVSLSSHQDKPANNGPTITNYTATYGDGSESHFSFSSGTRWVSTDGAGAHETLDVLSTTATDGAKYVLTRADQTQFRFDNNFVLLSNVDTNGVRMDYVYQGGKLQQVRDDTGHVITFNYSGLGNLTSITDQTGVTLVSYGYAQSNLASVTDRYGHVTRYSYDSQNGLLSKVTLPNVQTVNGQVQTFDQREMSFTYQSINWSDNPHVVTPFDQGFAYALKTVTDAMGGVTTFNYNFSFNATAQDPSDRDIAFKQLGGRYFTGGRTDVIDALGNQLSYTYDADGYITSVVDQQGFKTTYTYDAKDNLTSIVDRNGWGATNSDSVYFRALRKDLGVVDAAGNGKPVASLTAAEKAALLAKFTTSFIYDARGNLLSYTDNAGNITSYTYTSFNKVASETSAMGNALTTSNDALYQQKRTELGFSALLANLTAGQKTALTALYTTSYSYDAKQNLTQRTDAGGDVTNFEYNTFGNLTKRTVVYRDAGNAAVPAKNQVTTYGYDAFGNNTSMVDGEGNTTVRTFDHFGNLLTAIDGLGGVTTFTYDADNRLLSTTDPEGHVTVNAYDAVGNKISITDANGHTITQIFNKNNLLIATIDPAANAAASRTTTFTYDILGNRTEVLDAEGRKTTYAFNARRQLVTVTTPQVLNGSEALVNYQTTYAYDGESNIVTQIDNNGNVTQVLYTTNNLLKRQTDPSGNVTEYLYDANLQRVQVTVGAQLAPALRKILRFGYDEEDQLVKETDALGGTTLHAYDAPGNVVSMTDANGNKTDYEYDRNNRLLKETRPQVTHPVTGLPVRYTVLHQYDANGNEVSTTDENGHVTSYAFDKDNRIVMVTDGNSIKTVYSWDSRDNRTQIAIGVDAHLDANGHVVIDSATQAAVSTFTYDEFNQLIVKTDALGNALVTSDLQIYQNIRIELGFAPLIAGLSATDKTTLRNRFTERYEYDRVGNRTQMTDHLGRISKQDYDALNRVQSFTEAFGTTEQRSSAHRYDGNANLVKQTDSLGRIAHFTFDGNNRLVSETDPLGIVARHDYDNVGNLITRTLAFGTAEARTTRYVYDLNDRLTRQTDAEGHVKQYEYDAVGNRLKEIDARGGATQYVYDALNRNVKIIDPLSFQTKFEYDGVGNNITVIDANGGIKRLQYDGANRYVQTTDPMGRVMRLEYDRLDHIIKQTTAFGRPEAEVTQYLYDAQGNLRQVTDALGNVSTQGFDAVYNRTRHTDNNGHTTTTEFDALNRQIKVTDALGGITTYTYDLENNQLSETDALGRRRSFGYDAKNRLITQTDALGTQTTYGYDAVDNQVRITRAANRGVEARSDTFVYNKDDQLISQTDGLGHTTTYAYDANHNIVGTTDALGRVTTFTYDADNRVTQISDPLGHVTQFKYDAKGNRAQVIDARGNRQTSYYNLDDEVVLSVDGEGNAVARSYDGNGNVVSTREYMTPLAGVIDPAVLPTPVVGGSDRNTSFEYDKLNRLVKHTDDIGGVATRVYDAVGNKLRQTDENGHTTLYAYDDLNRLISQTDPLGQAKTCTYDAVGNCLGETDENGHTTRFVYDLEDRLIQETDPLGGLKTYTYDAVHNRTSQADQNGHTTTYAYDLANRLISETDPLLGVKAYAYDAVNNQISASDENGHTTTFVYDADNRLITQTNALGGVRTTVYDAVDNVISKTDENGHTRTYTYDHNDRLIAKTDSLGGVQRVAYDAVGNRISATDENGHNTSYEFDKNNRLVRQLDPLLGQELFSYDAAGNRLSMTDENGHVTSYVYDANDRLIKQTDPLLGLKLFTYDAVGNQLSMTDENGHTTSYVYDANDRRIKQTDALLGLRVFTYDAAGNQLSITDENGHITSYVYDANDRLIQQTDPLLGVQRFSYDAVGNRLSMTDENGHTTSYAYDAIDRMIRQIDPLLGQQVSTYDAAGNKVSMTDENGHETRYVYDNNDRLIKQIDPLLGQRLFTYDAAGNRLSTTDENGHKTSFVYDAKNRLIKQVDPLLGERLFRYDAADNRLSVTDENSYTTSYTYDANDRLISGTNALGKTQTYTYDAVGNRTGFADENDHTTHFTYDANNRLIERTDALLGHRVFTYDAVGNKLSETDENGHTTSHVYDANDRLIQQTDPLLGVRLSTYDAVGNRLSTTDENGHKTQYVYDANDRLIKQADPLLGERTFSYDAVGNRLSATDENGHTTHYVFDANDRLIKQTDPLSGERNYVYDAAGNMLSESDQNGHQTRYVYDGKNRLIKQIDPLLGEQTYTYDAAGNRLSETDENGHTTSLTYDADNRLITRTDALGKTRTIGYDAVGNRISLKDENGHLTTYAFDADNRLIKQTDPLLGVRLFTYDAIGNMQSETDENGHTTSFVYDANDRLIKQTNELSGERLYSYDAVGNQLSETDQNGRQTRYIYDANDRLVKQTDPLNGVRSFVYDAVGNQLSSTDENGHKTSYVYDANDRLIKQTDPLLGEQQYTYDAAGNRLSETDENGHATNFLYDADNRLIKRTDALGKARNFAYDAVGNLTGLTDENGHTTGYGYDADNRQVSQTDALGNTQTFAYDAVGNRTGMTDENGHTTNYAFDANNRQVSRTDALGKTQTYAYDAAGNRISLTDENGHRTGYRYDGLNRLIEQTDALNGVRSFVYDAVGNQLSMTDENGHQTSYVFDANDRLIRQADPLNGVMTYTYDAVGNRLSETDQNGHTTTHIYDANDRQVTEIDALGAVTSKVYDAVGNRVSFTDRNNHTTTYAYDADNRLIRQTDPLGGQRSFSYDAAGNQLSETDQNGHSTAYGYDADNRMISRTDALGKTQTYAYDAAGNRTSRTDENGNRTTYGYDANNRLISQTDALGETSTFTYDAVGNRSSAKDENGHTTSFAYDELNRLITQTDALGKTRITVYDAVGNRISQTDENGHTTTYAYDANDRTVSQTDALGNTNTCTYDAVGNCLSETDENGHTTTYIFDAINRRISRTDALGKTRAFIYDAVGNRTSVTDEKGRITAFEYDSNDRLVKQTDALGKTQTYVYDSAGNRISITDENGHTTGFAFDADNRRVSQTDALGKTQARTYDAAGNLLSQTDENGHTTRYAYDGNNRLSTRTDALGKAQTYVYDGVGNRIGVTDENGHRTIYAFDAINRLSARTDALGATQTYTHDAVGNRTSVTDENGHITSFAYDATDRLIVQTDALGATQTFIYDAIGNLTSRTDENGHTTSFAYDAIDRLLRRTDALGKTEIHSYDFVGNRLSTTDQNGRTTRYVYDALDRQVVMTDALGNTRLYSYDGVGNRLSATDENGHTTSFEYDNNDRLVKQTDPLGGVRTFAHDDAGNRLSETDENGHTTGFAFDANNRLVARTDALGKTQTYAYDFVGNRISVTDENGHATTFGYDADNRLISQTDALRGVMRFGYDAAGNRTSETDENGNTETTTYDANNRKASRTDALGNTSSCTYDAAGNRVSETDENGHTTTYVYDELNRLVRLMDALGFATTMSYDAVGSVLETRQQLSLADPSLQQVNRHAYDALNRRVASLSAEGYLKTFEYDAVGHVVKMTAFDDKFLPTAAGEAPLTGSGPRRITLSSYDVNDRLISETSPLGFVTLYEYDAVGNRTAKVEAAGTAQARRSEMRYDAANRVIDLVDALGIVTHSVLNAVGNVVQKHEAFGTAAVRVTHIQYDANDRVSQQTDALGVVSQFTYDAAGDLIARRSAVGLAEERTERFEYDAKRRQIAQINGEGERTEYAYDGVGNRTTVTVAKGLPEQRINRMRYDGDDRLIGQIDGNGVETQYEYDGAGNKVKTIQLAATYDTGGNSIGSYQGQSIAGRQRETLFAYDQDNRLIQVTNPMGGVTQYVLDALGNRTRIIDANGTHTLNTFDAAGRLLTNWVQGSNHGGVLVTNRYDAFGNIVQSRRGFQDGSDTRQTTYTYDQRNRQTSLTEYDKGSNLGVFNQAYSTVFEYDAFNNQTKIARGDYLLAVGDAGYDAAKAALAHPLIATFNYDSHDKLVASIDGVGNILAYGNNAHGNRVGQTSGFGTGDARAVTYSYDRADRLIARRTGTGGVVTLSYDKAGNQIEKGTLQSGLELGSGADTPVWVTEQFGYDGNGRVVTQTDGLGVSTLHVLDAFGNETATRFAAGTADERTVRFEFNANNELSAQIDALGNRTRFEVDKLGNRIAQTDALGYVTRLYYNELNQQTAALDAEGYLTTFSRDSAGNVLQTNVYLQKYTAPANHGIAPTPSVSDTPRTTTNEFDGAGNRIRKTDPDQRVKDFVYDSAGKLKSVTDHGSTLAGALALTADASARVQTFEYDAAGRVTRFTHVDSVTEDYAYDSANNKIRETITNPHTLAGGGSDSVRTTFYQYDADNRQTAQIFDPAGLDQTGTLVYDKAGNVIAKSDALGHVTTMTYDLANRMRTITDPLGGVIQFGYDRVGNRSSVTDALGNVTLFEFDKNNRPTKAILPAVDVFTIRDGLQTNVHPTSETKYDAVGNVIQEIDASGFKSTAFYDGNRNRIAEINGDNVLRTFSYDANGLVTSASLYMTRVDPQAQDAAIPPTPPSGPVRTITTEYDVAGRVTRTLYPAIDVTSLSGVNTANPSATSALVSPEERHRYNAFGERVQSTDRNGQVSYAYFDNRGRAIATVDSAGYLVESDFDDQGNVVQQRKYASALNLATVSAATRPAPPSGAVYTIDRKYDAANRLIEELSPPVAVDGVVGLERVATRYSYDANGNLRSRTLAADSPEAATEYYYYDAANRQVAIVNDARVLHHVGYDANGNKTFLKRFIDPVSGAVDLGSATLTSLLADITPVATQDQETRYAYDAQNREISLTDVMGAGSADDITISSKYDASSNLSMRTDAAGFVSQTAYDALGHITQTRSPDGNRSFVEYDAAGFKIKAWTGDLGANQATAASNVTASIGSALSVGWEVTGSQLTSYLVYDTTAHDEPSAYANESAQQGSGVALVDVALDAFSAGSVVYFRVVTVDAAGSRAWTAEYSVTVPVLMSHLSVAQAGSDLEVTARFNGVVSSPQLLYGSGAALNSSVAMVLQADGSYKAVVVNPAQGGQGLSYQVRWTANGNSYTTQATTFEAPGAHEAIDGTFIWPVPLPAQGDAQVVLLGGARQEDASQVNGQLRFTPVTLANGSHVYHVLYGQSVAESHDFTVTNLDHQTATPGAATDITNSNGDVIGRSRTFTFQHGYATQIQVAMDVAEANRAAASLQVAYRAAGNTGLGGFTNVAATRAVNTFSASAALAPGDYDIKISYVDAGREVIVQWRRITVEATTLHAPVVQQDTTAPFDFVGLPATLTDDLSTTALSLTAVNSMIVVGRETDGVITQLANGTINVDPGLYTGPVDPSDASFPVPLVITGSAGAGAAKVDGLIAATYFTEIEYNALATKIASNEESGLWRRFGVDANGNTLVTRIYGSKADELAGRTPIVTYSAFDARNLEIARFGATAAIDANGDGIEETSARAVSRVTYDYEGRKLTQLDPNPGALTQHFEYDGVGNLVRQTDALGFATSMFYDRRGNEVRRIDARGNARRAVYDTAGRKVQDIDALNNTTDLGYDTFDRQISKTDALGHTDQMAYDQRDRLVQATDANGNATHYTYDKRDNRIWTEDANHHFFGHAYDAMGRVTNTYSFQSRTSPSLVGQAFIDALNITPTPTTLAQAIDAVGNAASPYRAALVNDAIAYDIFGNKRSETDAEGRQKFFTYGAFGRLDKQTDESGRVVSFGYDRFGRSISETRPKDATVTGAKNITRVYDDNGRLKAVTDVATLVSTTYTYDVAGARMHETVKAPSFFQVGPILAARNVIYRYDALGRMLSWSESVTAKSLNYAYDAVGNQTLVSGSNGVDHRYAFDANNRVTQVLQGASTLIAAYTYDAAGHRKSFNNGATTATYTYDAGDRVVRADITPNATPANPIDDSHMTWQYDAVGNVTRYQELAPVLLTVKFSQTNRYTANNRAQQTSTNDQRDPDAKSIITTLNALDKSGRVLTEGRIDSTDASNVKTTTYRHVYSKDGRELSITATGSDDRTGNTKSTFDANDRLSKLSLGQGDGQDSVEFKLFINNNDGQILRRYHDDGKKDNTNPQTQFLYANGHLVGETGSKTDGTTETVLDRGNYALIKNMGETFPTSSVSDYIVRAGDTLQSIAAQLYGNPSLWYVIADANQLAGSEALKVGTRLSIPNSTESGRITADTHTVYKESDLVGSKLPNLKTPAPSGAGAICAIIGAIILAILIAIIAIIITIVTVGTATPAAAALLGVGESTVATMIVGVAIGTVVGTVVAAAASAISQGINIAFGLQKEFNWKQFGGDVAGGVLGGIGALFSGTAQAVTKAALLATNVARIARVAAVGVDVAFQVAGEAVAQVITHDGRIEEPWMLGVAAAAGVAGELLLGVLGPRAIRAIQGAPNTAGDASVSTASVPGKRVQFADSHTVIQSKPVGDLAKVNDTGVASTLKSVDTQFSAGGSNGTTSLKLKNPSDSLAGNDNTPSLKPLTVADNTTSTISLVQSPNPLDKGAGLSETIATKKMLSGETASFDQKSVTSFDEGSVGKVHDNAVPIANLLDDEVFPMTSLPKDYKVTSVQLDVEQKSNVPISLSPTEALPEWPAQKLQRLVSENGATYELRATKPRDYSRTHARYTEDLYPLQRSAITKDQTKARVPTIEQRGQERMQKQFREVFDVGTENIYIKESRVKDTETFVNERIAQLRLNAERDGNMELADRLAKADLNEKLGLVGYTAKTAAHNKKSARLGEAAGLNTYYDAKSGKTIPQPKGVPDFEYINPVLRQYDNIDLDARRALDKSLDAYITYAVRGLDNLESHHGAVYRGGNFSHRLDQFNAQFKEGEIYTEKGFFSTTRDEKQAFEGDTLFVINSRGGGRRIEDISDAPHEAEVLFPPAARFKVLKIEELGVNTKVLQSDGDHAMRQRVVYMDELPPPKLKAAEKQGPVIPEALSQPAILFNASKQVATPPSMLSQDAALIPLETRILRAKGNTERTLPQPAVDLRRKVVPSQVAERLNTEFKTSSVDAEKSLKNYFELGMTAQTQPNNAQGRRLQLLEMHGQLSNDLRSQERELARSQNELIKALSRKDLEKIGLSRDNLPDVLGAKDRNNQLTLENLPQWLTNANLESQAKLSQAVIDQRLQVKRLQQEQKLLRDTVNDPVLMNSAYISSPTHAIELKRLGLQPSAAGRVGQFTDVRLQGGTKELGSGAYNTVYLGKYTLPDNKGSYEGVFKAEVRNGTQPPMAGIGSGIERADIRAGYRNVATTRLDDLLGFGGLTTRSEMAIHNNKLGTVSERAGGVSPVGPKIGDVSSFHDLNYGDPTLRRDLVRLQLMDAISGQVDRHAGNYFVKQNAQGKVLGVKGIDNDLSWGQDLKEVEKSLTKHYDSGEMASHLPHYLPPVVDKQAFDSIMSLNQQALKHNMGGLLTKPEMDAAGQRLLLVQSHLRTLQSDGRVLNRLEDWSGEGVTKLLTTQKDAKNTSYFARDFEQLQEWRRRGLVVAYPLDKT